MRHRSKKLFTLRNIIDIEFVGSGRKLLLVILDDLVAFRFRLSFSLIDIDKREVMLNIKPTISKLETTVKDPAVTILLDGNDEEKNTSGTNSAIPVANVRELDTILKLKDGQTAVIGGFTERVAQSANGGIPIMRALPLFGNLFSYKDSSTTATETIILVKATIVDNGKEVSEYERGILDTMADDPRSNEI